MSLVLTNSSPYYAEELVIMVEELVIIELEFELAMLSVLLIELDELGVEVESASKWSEAQFETKWN